MTKEQIEEAAKEYSVLTDNPKDSYSRVKGSLCIAFKDGAYWRINSVWHNMKEKPNFKILPILLKHKSGTIHFIDETPAHWEYMMKYYVRWAYIEDLLLNTEE